MSFKQQLEMIERNIVLAEQEMKDALQAKNYKVTMSMMQQIQDMKLQSIVIRDIKGDE